MSGASSMAARRFRIGIERIQQAYDLLGAAMSAPFPNSRIELARSAIREAQLQLNSPDVKSTLGVES
jgi:hypothetical protein